MSWTTFGHNHVKEILDKQILAGKIPHAYLFAGPEGLGKQVLALEFAKKILKVDRLDNHPDFQILDASGEITMELALDFIGKLGFKPFVAKKKVAIINNAQNLNQASSSALLKTLEEPSANTALILIASSARLLPTIVSRCQVFNFNAFSKSLLKEFASAIKISITAEMINLSFGSPGRLKKLAADKDFFKDEAEKIEQFKKISASGIGEKLLAITDFAEAEAEVLKRDLTSWLLWQAAELQHKPESFFKVQALSNAINGLGMNKNKKLVLQGLFLKI